MMHEKAELRKTIIAKRNAFQFRETADKSITKTLVDICANYHRIFVYINFGSEVSTTDLINKLLINGKEIYVPVCDTDAETMSPSRITSLDKLRKNKYGILEPCESVGYVPRFDVIIFPGVAFDKLGNRVGYGKGYYDKFVSELDYSPIKIGVCYDFQLMEKIPAEGHDIKMDMIVTETSRREI